MTPPDKDESDDDETAVRSYDHADAVVEAIAADDAVAFEALEPRLSEPLFPPQLPGSSGCCGFGGGCGLLRSGRRLDPPRLCHPLHLAVQLRAVRIFAAAVEASPDQLGQREPDGATLLHTLARCAPQLPAKAAKLMEDAAVRALVSDRRLAQHLLLSEDSCGLRPLEACIKFGAFRLAGQLLHVPGYLMKRRWRDRGWEVRRYRIAEYDPIHGDRFWLSPLILLTYVCQGQLSALKASGLAKDPLVLAWSSRFSRQMWLASSLRWLLASSPTCLFLLTIVVGDAQRMVSSFCTIVHCNRATYAAAATAGVGTDALTRNASLYYKILRDQTVKGIACPELHDSFIANERMVDLVVTLTAFIFVAKQVFSAAQRIRTRPIFAQRRETPGDCFIQQGQFGVFNFLSVVSGICLIVLAELYFKTLFWFHVLYPANGFRGLLLEQGIFGSTASFIIFNLLYFGQFLEIVSKSIGRLFFTFQRMNSSFRTALPLLFYWLVMFSLVFFTIVDTSDFTSNSVSMYSSIKIVLNMVNFPTDNTVAVIFHTLFFVFVGLNMLNFLIAFVNETFVKCNADFELAYWLLRLYTSMKTFYYCQWLLRLPHWLEAKRKTACRGADPIEITQPFFKKLKFTKRYEK